MKKFLLTVLFLNAFMNNSYGQEKEFVFSKERLTDFVVTDFEGKSQSELFRKTLDWVAITYKNPKEVIKAQIENEYIRIEGSSDDIFCIKALGQVGCQEGIYQIEISFKDNKYKFDIIELKRYIVPSQYVNGGWSNFDLNSNEEYYNKKGEIRNTYKLFAERIPNYFNNLNSSLKEFVLNDNIPSKSSDW
ncbi:DUF4468 domain-containing protein [Flavobacterium sp. xlx-214]|uniref:DUF4468 domain-containing protein n=1 Tax=unclassified Flavobacterium TaxID=196869 RepID=UPI0013D06268|nr:MULTISPECIES: DUF4468 domain-containing protein [unclassified Flavobacterium]MBA5792998.1 DUF4468 domain-containing protein [Flavobacterium sp. xlx-221]QMI84672.1 DUF4468 domain-containing protein [Flavobacterium sp. xlx-214]